jgi:hypothetical protein
MNIALLNGLTVRPLFDGRIGKHMPDGYEIYRWNWREKDAGWIHFRIFMEFGPNPYVLCGFSDGATVANHVAHQDKNCIGLILHSTMFSLPTQVRNIPILVLRTEGDRTPTFAQSYEMYRYYDAQSEITEGQVSIRTMPPVAPKNWYEAVLKHQFHNAVPTIRSWMRSKFMP